MNGLIAGILRSIPSDQIAQLLVNHIFRSELLPFGLSRFCSSFSIPFDERWKSHNCPSYVWISPNINLASVALNFSMFQLNKFPAKSPLAEQSLKFHCTPFSTWGFLFILFVWLLHVAINSKLHRTFGERPMQRLMQKKGKVGRLKYFHPIS